MNFHRLRAYNLFRQVRDRATLCAIPEDRPVPAFIVSPDWEFAGKTALPCRSPVGIQWTQRVEVELEIDPGRELCAAEPA